MNLLVKIGLMGLLAGGTASALYADPAGGWLSPNGQRAQLAGAGAGAASTAAPIVQPVGPAGASGVAPVAEPGDSASAGVAVTLSLPDIQARVRQLHEQIRADARHVQHLQQIARKEKDVIKLNCVNDKLVQVKPQMNLVDLGEAELETAGEGDRMGIFDGIAQAAENIRRLREEADQCIGESITTGGDSSNSFTGPDVPDDPTRGFEEPELEPPGYASPYN